MSLSFATSLAPTRLAKNTATAGARHGSSLTAGPYQRYKYPFPSIPRPKRNFLYYYNPVSTFKRGLSSGSGLRPSFRIKPRSMGPLRQIGTPSKQYLSTAAKSASSLQANWRWLAVPAVTIILLTVIHKKRTMSKSKSNGEDEETGENQPLLKKHPKLAKPWQVAAYSTLPLKAISRLWGQFNDITLPVWLRSPGYRFYAYVFGANLDEMAEQDLTKFKNLGEFFYRELKPGARPIDENSIMVSPSDGKVLHVGAIQDNQVEQVKGITYSLDALLGTRFSRTAPSHSVDFSHHSEQLDVLERHEDFAVLNGINYTLDDFIGDDDLMKVQNRGDKAVTPDSSSANLASLTTVTKDVFGPEFTSEDDKELFYAVIYLAPGDYHRFHSPVNWVSRIRRHFIGELYSVAPYFQERLKGLLALNERVALLGKWRYGFFSMTPVGATNVGSIQVNFDKDLRTNQKYYETLDEIVDDFSSDSASDSGDSASPLTSRHHHIRQKAKNGTCYEASYAGASKLLGGFPIVKGQEMGGFHLGSTVVLVFEAPKSFKFSIKPGDVVKVGQSIGGIN